MSVRNDKKKRDHLNRGLILLRSQVNQANWFGFIDETGNSTNYYKCVTFFEFEFLEKPASLSFPIIAA